MLDYESALAEAAAAAARLGAALARFELAVKALAEVSPKCDCGCGLALGRH